MWTGRVCHFCLCLPYDSHAAVYACLLTVDRVMFHVHKVMYNMLSAWLLFGLLQDRYNEFYITQNAVEVRQLPVYIPANVAETILFIGKAVQVLQRQQQKHNANAEAIEDVPTRFRDVMRRLENMPQFHSLTFELEVWLLVMQF